MAAACPGAGVAALGLAALTLGAAPAYAYTPAALSGSGSSADPSPTTVNYTGSAATVTVPTGVASVYIEAIGGAGGDSDTTTVWTAFGGEGAVVAGYLAVQPGEVFTVTVGGRGQDAGIDGTTSVDGHGGWGGASGGGSRGGRSYAGGGGGATTITGPGGATILVAGAGGGGGDGVPKSGGAGGDAATPPGNGWGIPAPILAAAARPRRNQPARVAMAFPATRTVPAVAAV